MVPHHPLPVVTLEERNGRLVHEYPMDTPPDQPAAFDEPLTYTVDPTPLTSMQRCEWIHSLSCLINSVLGAGRVLEFPVVLVVVDRPHVTADC